MPPIRTGLDERIKSVQQELKGYFQEAKHLYKEAINAFTKLDSEVYIEAKEARAKAREVNWDLTNDLLLILALNQPLMQDLRIIATYLRAVDTVALETLKKKRRFKISFLQGKLIEKKERLAAEKKVFGKMVEVPAQPAKKNVKFSPTMEFRAHFQ